MEGLDAYVFDFDMTLTRKHTGGTAGVEFNQDEEPRCDDAGNVIIHVTENEVKEFFGPEAWIRDVYHTFEDIRASGGVVYINTRGLTGSVMAMMEAAGKMIGITDVFGPHRLIEKVYGADCLEEIGESESAWSMTKLRALHEIRDCGKYDRVCFYDDMSINIEAAQAEFHCRLVDTETVLDVVRADLKRV